MTYNEKEYQAAQRERRRNQTLNAYGAVCVCCGESERAFLVVDHVNNDGAEHRQEMGYKTTRGDLKVGSGTTMHYWLEKNNYPPGFQILCFNCNMGKQLRGVCPHKISVT